MTVEGFGTAERVARRRETVRGSFYAMPAVVWLAVFFAIPLLITTVYSFLRLDNGVLDPSPTLANYQRFFTREAMRGSLLTSIAITLWTTVISVLLAYPVAYVLAFQVPKRWQRPALVLLILPFWTSYIVRSYAWLLVLSPTGVINEMLLSLGLISEPARLAYSRFATVMGFVHFFFMLVTLTIYANLVQLNPRYRMAASDLGASPLQNFMHVMLPLTLPGIAVGAFTTFVICIGDYVMPQILGGNRELVLPQSIFFQISRNADLPMAAAMSVILMIAVALAYVLSARWLKMDRL